MASASKRRGVVAAPAAKVTALILAAGASSRMGQPKPLVTILGQPLLARALETVRRAHPSEIVVVLGSGARHIRKRIDLRGATVVVNPDFAEGMGGSIRAGAAAAKRSSGPILIFLGDQPFVDPGTLRALVDQHAVGSGKILIPTFEGVRGNPILLDRSLVPELDALHGDIGCRAIFPDHAEELVEVPVADPGILIDVDTPAEVAQLEKALHGHPTPTVADLKPLVAERIALHREGPVRNLWRVRLQHGGPDHAVQAVNVPLGERELRSSNPDLLVVGEASVAKALAALGDFLGYRVTVVAPGARSSDFPDGIRWEPDLERLPQLVGAGTFAVVASTGLYDAAALRLILPRTPRYVGLVSSRQRGKSVMKSLKAQGLSEALLKPLHNPAGLNISAQEPEEIALSILSEITKLRWSGPTSPA